MNRVSRAEKLLSKISNTTGMSQAGKDWLIAVLDPFHDVKLLCQGYPDREMSPSVCALIKQQGRLSKPVGLPAGAWNAHIFVDDTTQARYNGDALTDGNLVIISDPPTTRLKVGGLQVVAYSDLAVIAWNLMDVGNVVEMPAASLNVQPTVVNGRSRMVSQGFEIHNTTPELTKSGTLTAYEQPLCEQETSTFFTEFLSTIPAPLVLAKALGYRGSLVDRDAVEKFLDQEKERDPKRFEEAEAVSAYTWPSLGARTYVWSIVPPNNTAEALLLPGSKQWEARYGAYCVQSMHSVNNPAMYPSTCGQLYARKEAAALMPRLLTTETLTEQPAGNDETPIDDFVSPGTQVGTLRTHKFNYNQKVPFSRKGVFLTGLHPDSTFTLNLNTMIESIVSQQKPELVTLAQPSPNEDYVAMQLYSLISKEMPVGVFVNENGLGDWFLGVVDEIANVVSSVGRPIMAAADAFRASRNNSASPTTNAGVIVPLRPQTTVIQTRQNALPRQVVQQPRAPQNRQKQVVPKKNINQTVRGYKAVAGQRGMKKRGK